MADQEQVALLLERCRRKTLRLTASHALLNAQVAALTGFSSVDDFRAWKVGKLTTEHPPLERILLLIGVLERLEAAFPSPERGTTWLHRSNARFGNLSPLQYMLAEGVSGFGVVAAYLAPEKPEYAVSPRSTILQGDQ